MSLNMFIKQITNIQRVKPLFSNITHLHEHHISSPHKSQNVYNRIKVRSEDNFRDEESPY